jgi:spermidine synthase
MSPEQTIKNMTLLRNNQSLNIILAILVIPVFVLLSFLISSEKARDGNVIYEKESRYHYIRVVDDKAVRTLLFTKGPGAMKQSAVYLDSPDKHVLEYSSMIFTSLAFVEEPQRVLVVGLGGGIIPSTFAKHFPSAQIDIVELDDEIVKVAEKFFNFEISELTNIIISDARVYVHQAKSTGVEYDIIVLDAFNGSYIPSHLTTKEFLHETFSLLKAGGCVVSNIHPRNELYAYQQRTYSAVAVQNYVFEGKLNAIVISTQSRDRLSNEEVKKKLYQLQNQFQFYFDLNSIGNKLIEKPTWNTKGDILTDDYSPVNVLKSKKY